MLLLGSLLGLLLLLLLLLLVHKPPSPVWVSRCAHAASCSGPCRGCACTATITHCDRDTDTLTHTRGRTQTTGRRRSSRRAKARQTMPWADRWCMFYATHIDRGNAAHVRRPAPQDWCLCVCAWLWWLQLPVQLWTEHFVSKSFARQTDAHTHTHTANHRGPQA